ncbi:MAG: restriction endonuclease [Chloroflexi bacterium]|nr:restriction endonuclease [Chloroflexota bacterium]MBE3118696.1 restriction endonuclease [Candidatus Atribacteria bacterium]
MHRLQIAEFEKLLADLCSSLTAECKERGPFEKSSVFELRVRETLEGFVKAYGYVVDFDPHPYIFPDIVLGEFGIEVKFTANDTWRSVANSVFESTRDQKVRHIYVVFGKMGGGPAVTWGKYEDCVIHVRTSHVPRFEVEMYPRESLFQKMGVSYDEFSRLPIADRMVHIRKYARGRLKKGERLWWLEDNPEHGHSLPLQVRLYMGLPQEEKRQLRAEAALLCPQIVKPSRSKGKYNDATIYLLTYHGVLCPQARDLFSAGSVALRSNAERGGNYILRALSDIETEMRQAAAALEDALFVEYWGVSVPPDNRISEWLKRADKLAETWKPSRSLFRK